MKTAFTSLFVAVAFHTSAAQSGAYALRPDLEGRVHTQNGSPLKDATVFIYTAGPRVAERNALTVLLRGLSQERPVGC